MHRVLTRCKNKSLSRTHTAVYPLTGQSGLRNIKALHVHVNDVYKLHVIDLEKIIKKYENSVKEFVSKPPYYPFISYVGKGPL